MIPSVAIINQRPGTCEACRKAVRAQAGTAAKVDGRWFVYCAGCYVPPKAPPAGSFWRDATPAPPTAPATPKAPVIHLERHGASSLMLTPEGFLGDTFFRAMVRITAEAGVVTKKIVPTAEQLKANPRLRTTFLRTCTLETGPRTVALLREGGFVVTASAEVQALLEQQQQKLAENLVEGEKRLAYAKDLLAETGRALRPYQEEGVRWLVSRARRGCLLADDMGLGKASTLTTPVLTPSGWRMMGDLKVGDQVIGSNGLPTQVVGVFPQGRKPVFRVTFNDGASTLCCDEHLWAVQTPNDRVRTKKWRVHSLAEIRTAGLADHNGNRKWFIPMVKAVRFEQKHLHSHLDTYVLGALLANGSLTGNAVVHDGTAEQRDELLKVLPVGVRLNVRTDVRSILSRTEGTTNPLMDALREVGVMGHNAHTKFIPEQCFTLDVEARLALLQGLCDNDGCVSKDGMVVEYNTVSPKLAAGVVALVQSLGGVARMSTRIPTYTYQGEKKQGSMDHRIRISMPEGMVPFRVPSKRDRFKPKTKYPVARAIASIEAEGEAECVCIAVDAPDHLYVAENYIVTHNTAQTLISLPTGNDARILVIGPAVAKLVWRNETRKWRSDIRPHVIKGRLVKVYKSRSKKAIAARAELAARIARGEAQPEPEAPRESTFRWPDKGELLVIGFECLPAEVPPPPPGVFIVVDEAHMLKNRKAQRTLRAKMLANQVRAADGTVWLLSATPMTNSPLELYSVLEVGGLEKQAYPTWSEFMAAYDGYKDQWGQMHWGTPTEAAAEGLRKVMLRRSKADVAKDIPAKSKFFTEVEVNEEGIKAIGDSIKQLMKDGQDIDQLLEDIERGRDYSFESLSKVRAALALAKTAAAVELAEQYEEAGEPLVVFSAHRAPIDALAAREGWACITGDQSAEEKGQIAEDFQAGKYKGLALTIRAGGVAITLTRASNAVFVDLDWTPASNAQAEDRIHRIGQETPVSIHVLVAQHPVDQRIQYLLAKKAAIYDGSVDRARIREEEAVYLDTRGSADVVAPGQKPALAPVPPSAPPGAGLPALPAPKPRQKLYWPGETTAVPDDGVPRPARDAREVWAQQAVVALSGDDTDFARDRNSIGWNKPDSYCGHLMAKLIPTEGLTDRGWAAVLRMLKKYHRQVGTAPTLESAPAASQVA